MLAACTGDDDPGPTATPAGADDEDDATATGSDAEIETTEEEDLMLCQRQLSLPTSRDSWIASVNDNLWPPSHALSKSAGVIDDRKAFSPVL